MGDNGWGATFHRHTFSNEIHRDGGAECTQPGTRREVYVFDPDILAERIAEAKAEQREADAQIADARTEFEAPNARLAVEFVATRIRRGD